MLTQLGDISVEQFLDEYWQKKPLLIRNLLTDINVPFEPEELAGLCCEIDIPARLVIHDPETRQWQLRHGPYNDEDFTSLPDTHWSLLVNDLEKTIPELQNIIEPFRFIPDWRIDDLMLSFAVEGGSVGPHVDQYDVFLIQAHGQRHWQINENANYDDTVLENCELSILKHFETTSEWTLNPGDVLYLPPKLPHYGVALNDCFTYSVGFRAPSQTRLIQHWLESFNSEPVLRFEDQQRQICKHPGEINDADLDQLCELMIQGIEQQKDSLKEWLGKYLTESIMTHDSNDTEHSECESINTQQKSFDNTLSYRRNPFIRIAFSSKNQQLKLYINGESRTLHMDQLELIQYLCKHHIYHARDLEKFRNTPDSTLLNTLLKKEFILPCKT